jgi:hypothetical protein
MTLTIEGVPEFLTRDQYLALFRSLGFVPEDISELRAAHDGVHALVFVRDADGKRRYPGAKHRVFIPVRDDSTDERTTRVTRVLQISDKEALAILAEHGMTGADASTALDAWKTSGDGHADAARVASVFRARGIA